MRHRTETTERTALDRIKETLAELPMDSLTRHWLEEDLSHLADADALQERIEELTGAVAVADWEIRSLERERDALVDELEDLREQTQSSVYEPGGN